jgi:hypothetical protein
LQGAVLGVCLFGLLAWTACAPKPLAKSKTNETGGPELKVISDIVQAVEADVERYERGGGKATSPDNPARTWGDIFWRYYELHRGSAASGEAAEAALRAFSYTGQNDVALAKMGSFAPDDPAWKQIVFVLLDAAEQKKDYAAFTRKVESVLHQTRDKKDRAMLMSALGRAYWDQGDLEHARLAFQALMRDVPESDYAKRAKSDLYELDSLNVGQNAPRFIASTIDGRKISLPDLHGKVVLLRFWATW